MSIIWVTTEEEEVESDKHLEARDRRYSCLIRNNCLLWGIEFSLGQKKEKKGVWNSKNWTNFAAYIFLKSNTACNS